MTKILKGTCPYNDKGLPHNRHSVISPANMTLGLVPEPENPARGSVYFLCSVRSVSKISLKIFHLSSFVLLMERCTPLLSTHQDINVLDDLRGHFCVAVIHLVFQTGFRMSSTILILIACCESRTLTLTYYLFSCLRLMFCLWLIFSLFPSVFSLVPD